MSYYWTRKAPYLRTRGPQENRNLSWGAAVACVSAYTHMQSRASPSLFWEAVNEMLFLENDQRAHPCCRRTKQHWQLMQTVRRNIEMKTVFFLFLNGPIFRHKCEVCVSHSYTSPVEREIRCSPVRAGFPLALTTCELVFCSDSSLTTAAAAG